MHLLDTPWAGCAPCPWLAQGLPVSTAWSLGVPLPRAGPNLAPSRWPRLSLISGDSRSHVMIQFLLAASPWQLAGAFGGQGAWEDRDLGAPGQH